MLFWARRKNMRRFRKFRDERFALTTLQNPLVEVRTYAELVQAAQKERENQAAAAQIPAPVPVEVPATPPLPAPAVECVPDSIPPAQVEEQSQEIVASEEPDPLVGAPEPLDLANDESADPDAADLESARPGRAATPRRARHSPRPEARCGIPGASRPRRRACDRARANTAPRNETTSQK